jgi:hypothetical protein
MSGFYDNQPPSTKFVQPPDSGPRTLGVILIIVASVLAGYLWLVHNAELWPTSSAEIAATRIEAVRYRRRYSSYTEYQLYHTLRYPANGETYSKEEQYGKYSTQQEASKVAAKLKNAYIMVRYKAEDPRTMMTEVRLQQSRVIAMPVALMMIGSLVAGLVFLVIGLSISASNAAKVSGEASSEGAYGGTHGLKDVNDNTFKEPWL